MFRGVTLSETEADLLARLRSARTTREIADELGIPHSLLRVNLLALYRRMRVRNRAEAIAWAVASEAVDSMRYGKPPKIPPLVEEIRVAYFLSRLCAGLPAFRRETVAA